MRQNYWRVFAKSICKNWNKPAITDYFLAEDGMSQDTSRGDMYTYREMCSEIFRLCELFRSLGLQKGDHIAICGANSAHWMLAYFAVAAYQGIVVVVLNSQTAEDIAHQIDFAEAKVLFADTDVWGELQGRQMKNLEWVISLDNWAILQSNTLGADKHPCVNGKGNIISLLANLVRLYISFTRKNQEDLSVIVFTSGSTSGAKGVMVAHRVYSVGGELLQSRLPAPNDNRNVLAILPFGHMFGLVDANSALYTGGHVYILRTFVRPNALLKIMMDIRPYRMMLIPSMMDAFVAMDQKEKLAQCNAFLKYGIAGGAVISQETIDKLMELKFPLTIGYGQTEAAPLTSISSPWRYKKGSCGQVIKSAKVCIAENGEILVKGENVMLGYYKDPEATAQKIDKDGWLHTGDKGYLDEEGYLYVEGRLNQDMIVLPNGENINPEEIENKINALPEVKESIVLERGGHLVAIVVPSSFPFTGEELCSIERPVDGRRTMQEVRSLRRHILRAINPQLPLFCQLYDLELTEQPLARTEKQTLKRYLYK